jgi:hypothetical protein
MAIHRQFSLAFSRSRCFRMAPYKFGMFEDVSGWQRRCFKTIILSVVQNGSGLKFPQGGSLVSMATSLPGASAFLVSQGIFGWQSSFNSDLSAWDISPHTAVVRC